MLTVTGLWIGDSLPPLAKLCIRSYQDNGFNFRLLAYARLKDVPAGVEIFDAAKIVPEDELFVHASGSLAPTADRIRYSYLAIHGGLWTDMDVVCLKSFTIPETPLFFLQEPGIANLAVIYFPPGHEVMKIMALQMADPAAPLPWDGPEEASRKASWIEKVPEVIERRRHAEWSLGGPEGFTQTLKHCGIFDLVLPQESFSPVHYTGWRWNFDGTLFPEHEIFKNSLGIHLWAELLRREPDAFDFMAPLSLVAQLMAKHNVSIEGRPQHELNDLVESPRILVGICSCQIAVEKRESIRRTWLTHKEENIETVFFVGGENNEIIEGDTVIVKARDTYEYLPQKVVAFFRYALINYEFDWLFKCDDDTYVHLPRLSSLIDKTCEIIGSEFLSQRGSPSGGAGYFLSRRIVAMLAADQSLPLCGYEDVIVGEAAIKIGAKALSSHRLRMNSSVFPRKDNDVVTAHWISPDRMHSIFKFFDDQAISNLQVCHPFWSDQIDIFSGDLFRRVSTSCCGSIDEQPNGDIILNWFGWAPEVFSPSSGNQSGGAKVNNAKTRQYIYKCKLDEQVAAEAALSGKLILHHIGCGPITLDGWNNVDLPNVDIRDPLPWPNGSADGIFLEHVIEHVTPPEAYRFMREAFRVLKRGGILRLAFPDVLRIASLANEEYRNFLTRSGWSDGSDSGPIASIVLNHGHLGVWSEATMKVILESIGFVVSAETPGSSRFEHMAGLESHGKQIGVEFNLIETCCLDAIKL